MFAGNACWQITHISSRSSSVALVQRKPLNASSERPWASNRGLPSSNSSKDRGLPKSDDRGLLVSARLLIEDRLDDVEGVDSHGPEVGVTSESGSHSICVNQKAIFFLLSTVPVSVNRKRTNDFFKVMKFLKVFINLISARV